MLTAYYDYGVADYTLPRRPDGRPGIARRKIRVEVISGSAANSRVRFMEFHADGRGPGPGTVATVRTRNLSRLTDTAPPR